MVNNRREIITTVPAWRREERPAPETGQLCLRTEGSEQVLVTR
jgi:hypothetical protein